MQAGRKQGQRLTLWLFCCREVDTDTREAKRGALGGRVSRGESSGDIRGHLGESSEASHPREVTTAEVIGRSHRAKSSGADMQQGGGATGQILITKADLLLTHRMFLS